MLNNCLFFLSPAHVRTNLNSPLPPRPGPKTFHRSRARGTARRFAPRPTPPPTSPLPPAKPSQISPAAPAAAAAAAAHLAVAAYLAVSAPDFDAAAGALFGRPGGRARRAVEEGGAAALASDEADAVADQFEAAVGNSFSQTVLRGLWGDRAAAEERVRELLAVEWAAIGQSRLEMAAERIVGDGAIETWRAADEVTRAKYRLLAGEQRAREIEGKLGETIPQGNQISTPEVHKVMDALKSSCANLHSVVEDPLPAAKAAADEVLAARMDKAVDLNAGEVSNQPTACDIAGPSAPADNLDAPRKGTAASLMDWNPTARTFQWEDSPDPDGSRSPIHRPQLPSPRRTTFSPLQPADNKAKRRKARKWCALEEETLRKGVEQYGNGNWKDILTNNPDVFIGRKAMDLKDKWRNMMR
ncbi:hypothetical protein OsI_21915 [Oryza sativa Indica Group]|uniref:Uncharacterized protein n=1 Tax=Oryza sativa subsp. indica TaxID=39946 RepID=A2YA05_ORYSI|nr:hypothetical protein OsI_21915 [Oryza sativa Indica Group]